LKYNSAQYNDIQRNNAQHKEREQNFKNFEEYSAQCRNLDSDVVFSVVAPFEELQNFCKFLFKK